MENVFTKWLSLSGLKPVAVSKSPSSKGWVTMNGAHVFIGGGGGGGGGGGASSGGGGGATAVTQEIKPVKTSPEKFATAFSGAIKHSDHPAYVNHYTAQDIKNAKMKAFSANNGETGVLIHNHGDGRIEATGLYNVDGKGQGVDMLKYAVAHHGVNYVECFGDQLVKLYKKAGMKVTESYPFDPTQAPANWNYAADNHPDYNIMHLASGGSKGTKAMSTESEKPWFDENGRFIATGQDLEDMRKEAEAEADPEHYAKYGMREWIMALSMMGILHTDGSYPDDWPDDWPRWEAPKI